MEQKTERCAAKIGQPDIVNGMATCGKETIYLSAAESAARGWGDHTGWQHAEGPQDHHAIPESWVR